MSYLSVLQHPDKTKIIKKLGQIGTGYTYQRIAVEHPPLSPSALSAFRRKHMPQLIAKSEKAKIATVEAELERIAQHDALADYAIYKINQQGEKGADAIDVRDVSAAMNAIQSGVRWRGTVGGWWTDRQEVNDVTSLTSIRALVADTVTALAGHPEALEAFRQVVTAHKLVPSPDQTDDIGVVDHETATSVTQTNLPAQTDSSTHEVPDW